MTEIVLPDSEGRCRPYILQGQPPPTVVLTDQRHRSVFAAAHVVADPWSEQQPGAVEAAIDWSATLAFRRHLAALGLGIAEAMDTAQRGMGLAWPQALQLIRHSVEELPPQTLIFAGVGSDQLPPQQDASLDQLYRAYVEQIEAVQKLGGRLILMASRALVRVARSPEDYQKLYRAVLRHCDQPVILHWLGEMFDPALRGYWGSRDFAAAASHCLAIIEEHREQIEGIKLSLLAPHKEIDLRRRLPVGVKMYSGDDFHYPRLIAGDEEGHSHALLGVFNPLAPLAAAALQALSQGDKAGFHRLLDPTVPLARQIFCAPTQHYKTGVVFLAWLAGLQDHFILLNGAQSMRSLPHFVSLFKQADACNLLPDPDLAVARMRRLLALYSL